MQPVETWCELTDWEALIRLLETIEALSRLKKTVSTKKKTYKLPNDAHDMLQDIVGKKLEEKYASYTEYFNAVTEWLIGR